jgi:uncharacterized protein (UPF0333 family)
MLKRNTLIRRTKKKGQSTVEYIILVAAIIAALIIFLGPAGLFRTSVTDTYTAGTDGMTNMAKRLNVSRGTQPTNIP